MKEQIGIYFIHSSKINYNEEIYLPILRSNYLSNYKLIFPESNDNINKYYKDLINENDLLVINLTYSDTGLSLIAKDASSSGKPVLALARKDVGYDEKYQKLFKSVLAYSTEEEFRNFVEIFAKNYEGKIISGKVDPTIVLGSLN